MKFICPECGSKEFENQTFLSKKPPQETSPQRSFLELSEKIIPG